MSEKGCSDAIFVSKISLKQATSLITSLRNEDTITVRSVSAMCGAVKTSWNVRRIAWYGSKDALSSTMCMIVKMTLPEKLNGDALNVHLSCVMAGKRQLIPM